MASVSRALVLAAAGSSQAYGSSFAKGTTGVTPIEKVITLVTNLKAEVEADGTTEAATYDTFACFCKTKTASYSTSILNGKDSINSLSADIAQKTALKGQKQDELLAEKKHNEVLNQDLSDTEAQCAADKAAYDANNADLSKALNSLANAITTLESSKPGAGGGAAADLLAVRSTIKSSLDLADAMQIIDQGPKWNAAFAFVQQGVGVDPSDPEFKFHSQGIIHVLKQLQTDFTNNKNEADQIESSRAQACVDKVANFNQEITLSGSTISSLEGEIGGLAAAIASSRNSLVEADNTLQDDQLYLKDLTEMCEERAKDYDQRSHLRGEEVATLTQALAVLTDTVKVKDVANVRALLQQQRSSQRAAPPVFLQERAAVVNHHTVATETNEREGRKKHALAMLQEAGAKMQSTALLSLVSRASSSAGPFDKVKGLIEKLIQRLVHEATEEATKKGYCDTSLAQAETDRDFRREAVLKLNTEIYALEVKRDALEAEIADLIADITALNSDLAAVTLARSQEKADNLNTLNTAKDGAVGVKEAIMILKSFYTEAAKAKAAFVQYSPVQEDTSGAGFEGNYAGKQDAMKGVMGLLEVIQSDFERTIRKTTEAEKEASAAFVVYDRAAKAEIQSKETKKELDNEDLSTTKSTIDTKLADMQKNQDLQDQALRELEALKPMCTDSGMSYADRVAKREEEIAHLKTALCILDEDQVEVECQGR